MIYIWKLTGFMSKKDWAINVVRKLSCAKRMDSKSLVLLIFSTSWLYCASSTSTCIPTQPREHHDPLRNKVKWFHFKGRGGCFISTHYISKLAFSNSLFTCLQQKHNRFVGRYSHSYVQCKFQNFLSIKIFSCK